MNSHLTLPPLPLEEWRSTRDSLHDAALVLGTLRGLLAPIEPHWSHVSLRVIGDGLTTKPMPITAGHCEIRLNLPLNQLEFVHLQGKQVNLPLSGQSQATIATWLLEQLRPLHPVIDSAQLPTWNETARPFDQVASRRFGQVLLEIATVFENVRLHLPGRTSPVQLWPHHFDLAFLWFSGRKVPGKDLADLDNSDEQINVGFMPGDNSVKDPYFYATAYPEPTDLANQPWPKPGRWFADGWRGVIATYADFLKESHPSHALTTWTKEVHTQLRRAVIQPEK